MIPIQSRGCKYLVQIYFLQEMRLYRHKSEKIKNDIKHLYEEHGVEQFWFVDSLVNGSIKQFRGY